MPHPLRTLTALAAAFLLALATVAPAAADPAVPDETSPPSARTLAAPSANAPAAAVGPVDVYTTPGEHLVNGRRWKTACEPYSSVVDRCRTEIWATVTSYNGRVFTNTNGWTFNNLTYKPAPLATWAGNPIATPGHHTINGRQWKVECGTEWTGANGCRTMIMSTVPVRQGSGYRMAATWVFNNIIHFTDGTPKPPPTPQPETVITPTTQSEVASTWRAGCPVGPSQLSTIRINQLGLDGTVHRGEIIVRRDLAPEVADVFERTLAAQFPVAMMRNPNGWGGNDIAMMAANNSSAFNCRHVVGNPSRQSPHAYGIAVDINPWQNPYRDPSGRWWPSTDHVSRTPVVPGQLTATSAPVVAFKSHGWDWFSGWDWHHFEYRGAARTALSATVTGEERLAATAAPTAGGLTSADLSVPQGWATVVGEGSPEEGWLGNGSWTHEVDPGRKSVDLFALGCEPRPDVPAPNAALEGSLDRNGSPGVVLALQFTSTQDATLWFDAWRASSESCADASPQSGTSAWQAERVLHDGTWTEAAHVDGTTVRITMLRS